MSRALGDHFVKENNMGMSGVPFVSECYTLTDEDTILVVASDGVRNRRAALSHADALVKLWDVISGQNAMELVEGHRTAEKMASTLMTNALSDSQCLDNVTIIVARL